MSSYENEPIHDAVDSSFSGESEAEYDPSPTAHIGAEPGRIDRSVGPTRDVPGMLVMGHTCYACVRWTPKIRCVYCAWVGDWNGMVPLVRWLRFDSMVCYCLLTRLQGNTRIEAHTSGISGSTRCYDCNRQNLLGLRRLRRMLRPSMLVVEIEGDDGQVIWHVL